MLENEELDDMYCQQLYQNYLEDTDPNKDDVITLEECKKEWHLSDK